MYRLVLTLLVVLGLPSLALAQDGAYRVNAGDLLDVSVWGEEDLSREVLVLPDGTMTIPLAGQMKAEGRTTTELEEELRQRLARYIPDAVITIGVANASGNRFYVVGEVNRPGEFQITRPIDVMQALSIAGGLTAYASQNNITILRRQGGQQVALSFRYRDVRSGNQLETNIQLQAGDVIVVPDSSLF
jgi:polysaccharide biosynthesis/export protein